MQTNGELYVIGMIQPNDVVADVGANIGEWSLNAFMHEPSVLICCFEPIPFLHPKLQQNLKGKSVLLNELALSDEKGIATFGYYPT